MVRKIVTKKTECTLTLAGVSAKLVYEDAFTWLQRREEQSIHAVVTDPPYAVVEYSADQLHKKRSGNGGVWRLPQNFDGFARKQVPRFTDLTARQVKAVAEFNAKLATALFRVLVPGGHVILASQNVLSHWVLTAFVNAGFEVRGTIARVVNTFRGGDRPKGAHELYPDVSVIPRSAWEPWLVFRRPSAQTIAKTLNEWGTGALRRPRRDLPFSDLIVAHPPRGPELEIAPHPTLKPQALMRRLVHASLPVTTGIVLDPFMGSGSTVAAALAVGVRSIGIERDQTFFSMACKAVRPLAQIELRIFGSDDVSPERAHKKRKGLAGPQTKRPARRR